jgi:DNA-binding XRE family transcriptional regulator
MTPYDYITSALCDLKTASLKLQSARHRLEMDGVESGDDYEALVRAMTAISNVEEQLLASNYDALPQFLRNREAPPNDADSVAFGRTLRELRERRNLGQGELGEMCGGLTQPYISELESGVRNPSFTTINKLAKALRVKPAVLLNGGRDNE